MSNFCCLYSGVNIFVFAVNSRRHFLCEDDKKRIKLEVIFA